MARSAFELVGRIALEGAKKVKANLKELGRQAKDSAEGMKSLGETMTTHITAPLAALGAGAGMAAIEMQKASGTMQAQLGLTAEEAEALNESAKALWREGYGESMEDVTRKVAEVTRHLGELGETDLKAAVAGADLLQQQFGAETQESIVAVKTLMDNFGMSSQEAMDYLTAGFQEGLDYGGEFLDTVREYSTYFKDLGFSGEDFFNSLAAGAEAGAFQLDKVGDGMKEFSLRSKETSETTTDAFEGLGLNAANMISAFNAGGEEGRAAFEKVVTQLQNVEDETLRNQIATDLFGTQYEDLGEEAFNALLEASDGLGDVEGRTRTASEAVRDNLGTEFKIFSREAIDSLVPLGETVLDLAQTYLPPLIEKVTDLAEWFAGLSDNQKKGIAIFGVFAAAIGPVLVVLGNVIMAITKIIPVATKVWGWIKKLRTVFTLFRTALLVLSGPVGIVIALITGLVLAGIHLYKNWDEVKAKLSALWDNISAKASQIFSKMTAYIGQKVDEAKNWVSNKMTSMKEDAISQAEMLRTKAQELFQKTKNAIMDPITEAADWVKEKIEGIQSFFDNLDLKIEIPSIKLPKFGIKNWSLNPKDWIENRPELTVDWVNWYKTGGIFDSPSVIGVGEAGREAVLPLEGRYMRDLARTIATEMPGRGEPVRVEVPVYLNGREVARAIAPNMDRELERERRRRETFSGI
jgi:phage-related minor tail protein